jgi:hypothetical protein
MVAAQRRKKHDGKKISNLPPGPLLPSWRAPYVAAKFHSQKKLIIAPSTPSRLPYGRTLFTSLLLLSTRSVRSDLPVFFAVSFAKLAVAAGFAFLALLFSGKE